MKLDPGNSDACPLDGLLIVDLSQFLAGPFASLRLQDLGARVIKIERPGAGDLTRSLYLSDTEIGGDSTLFHAINRGKESLALDLKKEVGRLALQRLLTHADVMIQNFRPGVIGRLGFDWDRVHALNPRLVYASISGYGEEGPWQGRPGQDLLAQARSGVMWLSGNSDQGPVPVGLPIADMLAGGTAVQGILAALVRRGISGRGSHIQTSLLEVLIDLQFEVLTTYLNDGGRLPQRGAKGAAHAYLGAPYGIYQAADGWLALAMTPVPRIMELMQLDVPERWLSNPQTWFAERNAIQAAIAKEIKDRPLSYWLDLLEPADIWCAPIMSWPELLKNKGFTHLNMVQKLTGANHQISTTSIPLRINGDRPRCHNIAPTVGQHSRAIIDEFGLSVKAYDTP